MKNNHGTDEDGTFSLRNMRKQPKYKHETCENGTCSLRI